MGDKIRIPLNPADTIVFATVRDGFQGAFNWTPMMPKHARIDQSIGIDFVFWFQRKNSRAAGCLAALIDIVNIALDLTH